MSDQPTSTQEAMESAFNAPVPDHLNVKPSSMSLSSGGGGGNGSGSGLGLVPRTFEDAFRLARLIHASRLAPYQLKTAEAVCVVILKGLELNIPPMAALSGMTVIGGKPAMYGDLAMAKVRESGLLEEWDEFFEGEPYEDDFKAVCIMKRKGEKPIRSEYSVADAKTALLWGKTGREGEPTPWITNPKRMLKFRARHFCCRDTFQDVLLGFDIAEELQDAVAVGSLKEPAFDLPPSPGVMQIASRAEAREAERQSIRDWGQHAAAFKANVDVATSKDAVDVAYRKYVLQLPPGEIGACPADLRHAIGETYRAGLARFEPKQAETAQKGAAEAEEAPPAAKTAAEEPAAGPDASDEAPPPAPTKTLTEPPAPESGKAPTWGERLEAFKIAIEAMGHDTFVKEALGDAVKTPNMPPKIVKAFQAAAEARLKQLDGHKGPAAAKEPTPDEENAAPAADGEATDWAKFDREFRKALAGTSTPEACKAEFDRLMKEAGTGIPADVKGRLQNAFDTILFRLESKGRPPVTAGKAAFESTDAMEDACDKQATTLRQAKTLPDLDAAWEAVKAFVESHVVDRENTDKLENVYKQRRRLIESKQGQA